jgi:hypothetical protein
MARRRGLHNPKKLGLVGILRERGLPVGDDKEEYSPPAALGGSSQVMQTSVQTSEDVVMGDHCFNHNDDGDASDVSEVEAEAGSVTSDNSDEFIGKVPISPMLMAL